MEVLLDKSGIIWLHAETEFERSFIALQEHKTFRSHIKNGLSTGEIIGLRLEEEPKEAGCPRNVS